MGPAEKAFLDPVHGFILIDDDWLLQLIDTAEFQRLRRVRQLGASFGTYHGAEHTRFGHSLGALHIMRRILARLEHVHGGVDEEARVVAQAAALLHDVGHGPLSHCIEHLLTPQGHEHWTKAIVTGDTDVRRALCAIDPSLPEKVAAVIRGDVEPLWVRDLVSSQLDVDRMDYLLRDALFTGAEYGRFQLDRIVNTLVLHDGRVVVQRKGLQAIEEYVLARHFMYWRVYFHKTIRGMELLLRAAVRRAQRLAAEVEDGLLTKGMRSRHAPSVIANGPLHVFFQNNDAVNEIEYAAVDDSDLFVALKQWSRTDDKVLADLSGRFLRRRLLKPVFPMPIPRLSRDSEDTARDVVRRAGFDPDYYCLIDDAGNVPYDTYAQSNAREGDSRREHETDLSDSKQPIVVVDGAGNVTEISRMSGLIDGLARLRMRAVNVYVPERCRRDVADALKAKQEPFD